jgi:hypothetical protein
MVLNVGFVGAGQIADILPSAISKGPRMTTADVA